MDKVSFGKLFKHVREEKNISQSELSYGVCTPRTIYNIEKGYNIPSIELMLHFANKLGFDFLSILSHGTSENGLVHYKLFYRMENLYENQNYGKLVSEVDRMLNEIHDFSPYQYQILHWYKGICRSAVSMDYEGVIKEFELALSYTRKQGIREITKHYCSLQELNILNSYGMTLLLREDYHIAEEMLSRILNNLLRYGKIGNEPLFLRISCNLARCRNEMGRPGEALHVSLKAIAVAQKYRMLNSLAELYIEKGNSHDLLGETEERNRAFKRFIYLQELCGNDDRICQKKKKFEMKYGIRFDSI